MGFSSINDVNGRPKKDMNRGELAEWLHQFRPVLYLHSDEHYFPSDMQQYIREAKVWLNESQTLYRPEVRLNATILGEWMTERSFYADTLILPEGKTASCIADYHPTAAELQDVPLVAFVQSSEITEQRREAYLCYAHVYAYNGDVGLFGCNCWPLRCAEHFADIEHVTVHVVQQGDAKPVIQRVYFSKHSGGEWVSSPEMEGPDRVVVYVARHTHASYAQPKNVWRLGGLTRDQCDRGIRWDPERLIVMDRHSPQNMAPEERWTWFPGTLGNGHVSGLTQKQWWHEREEDEPWGQGCSFPSGCGCGD